MSAMGGAILDCMILLWFSYQQDVLKLNFIRLDALFLHEMMNDSISFHVGLSNGSIRVPQITLKIK